MKSKQPTSKQQQNPQTQTNKRIKTSVNLPTKLLQVQQVEK